MKYKMLALDLDGTLLMRDLTIPEELVQNILRLQDEGVVVTLATGRMYTTARMYAQRLGIHKPLVTYNGAWVQSPDQDTPLFDRGMTEELQHAIITLGEREGWYLQLYNDHKIVVEKISEHTEADPDMEVNPVLEVGTLSKADIKLSPKIMSRCDVGEVEERVRMLQEYVGPELFIASSHPRLIEMMRQGTSKSQALKKLCEFYGIAPEETVVCGDSGNDLDMVKWAGMGCAMGNATDSLKAAANYVCQEENSWGVLEVIKKFF